MSAENDYERCIEEIRKLCEGDTECEENEWAWCEEMYPPEFYYLDEDHEEWDE